MTGTLVWLAICLMDFLAVFLGLSAADFGLRRAKGLESELHKLRLVHSSPDDLWLADPDHDCGSEAVGSAG